MGGLDKELHEAEMVPAKMNGQSELYEVTVRIIYVRHSAGGESAQPTNLGRTLVNLNVGMEGLNAGGVIVDVGTTDTYWKGAMKSEFCHIFQVFTGIEYSNDDMILSDERYSNIHTILFQLVRHE